LVNGGDAGHDLTIRPEDDGEGEFVYPAFENAFVVDTQVSHDGLVANEDVVRRDNRDRWNGPKFGTNSRPHFGLSYSSHGMAPCAPREASRCARPEGAERSEATRATHGSPRSSEPLWLRVGVCIPTRGGPVARAAMDGFASIRRERSFHIRRIWGDSVSRSETRVKCEAFVGVALDMLEVGPREWPMSRGAHRRSL